MKSAVILAAGEGKRAWPYCGIRQKVTVPVLNVPAVRRLALDLIALGVEDIVAVVGCLAGQVRHALGGLPEVRFAEQPRLDGPVGAALTGLNEVSSDTALLCCGDAVTSRETMKRVIDTFEDRGAAALMLLAERPRGLTASWTSVETGTDGLVQGVCARGGPEHARFAGVAAVKAATLKGCLARDPGIMRNVGVGAMPPLEGDLAFSFDLMREDGVEVHTLICGDFFVDVDKPWHIVDANYKAARHLIASLDGTVIEEGAFIEDGADIPADAKLWLGPGARIGKGCHLGGSLVLGAGACVTTGAIAGHGAVAGPRTRIEKHGQVGSGSVLGADNVVSHCAEFDGVTFDVVYLYHNCCLAALVGTHVDIGASTVCGTWRFDDGVRTQVIEGHEEKPECYGAYTFIGDYCRTGVNATFTPGVKVGYYSCVGPGAIVYDDVPERTILTVKQEHVQKPWGPEKY